MQVDTLADFRQRQENRELLCSQEVHHDFYPTFLCSEPASLFKPVSQFPLVYNRLITQPALCCKVYVNGKI